MKKNKKIILLIAVFMLTFGIVIAAIGLLTGGLNVITMIGGGMWDINIVGSNTTYINEYSTSNTYETSAADVDALEIDWLSGQVEVVPYNGSTIKLTESSNGEITKKNSLRFAMVGTTLEVDYKEEGASFFSFGFGQVASKRLVIQIPKQLAKDMTDFTFSSTSADLEIGDVHTTSFDADTVSGNIIASDVTVSDEFSVNTTSGDLSVDQVTADSLTMDTVSGNIEGEQVIAREIEMNSASGGLLVHFTRCPDTLEVDTVSGDTKIYLPKDSSATISLDSVSGDLSSDFPTKMDGDEFVIGSGRSSFDLSTASGDVQIKLN